MPALIDTNIAIHLRDGDSTIIGRYEMLASPPSISILTQIELEGGVYAVPELTAKRRETADALLSALQIHDFTASMASVYRDILAVRGYSRRRVTDRMIAATAIVHGLTLITINGDDFRDIPGLDLEIWPNPTPQ
ncbi:MAG: PIN domain-containing protein [Sphingomonas sp.]|uniref:PIN domain-containing protein n=1 Tax=Sphingomonas sp. TaxID=28214 RepID=UPI00356ABB3D